MTNKINGIDVSECNIRFNHFEKNICELGNRKLGELHYLCSENPNCYFKQFKRLQKENEGLKSLNDFNVQKIEVLQEENEELYKALEEIRNYASVLYGEPLIDGSKIRLKSGMYRIKTKINEVLNDRN